MKKVTDIDLCNYDLPWTPTLFAKIHWTMSKIVGLYIWNGTFTMGVLYDTENHTERYENWENKTYGNIEVFFSVIIKI